MNKIRIPEKGQSHDAILEQMNHFRENDADWRGGRTWSLVYSLGDGHTAFLKEAHGRFFSENALNPLAFKSLKRFESEVVRMTADMLHGDDNVVGTMTAGGTESCMLAVKTYRDMARAKRPWLRKPEMIAPESVHVAFEKGAHYFDVKLTRVPVDANYRVDPEAVRKRVNRNTILIIGSAPSYPYGVVDPIPALGEVAQQAGLPLHVDGCLGGFMLPFVEKLGYALPPFDFRVPGVTSMSADVHKYGYSAKGASVVLYRNMDYLKHQFFVYTDWSGGIYI
ncbi:MAG TPA: aspartate aminotransferase family protein, partial [Candidatus Hydrogenedentes bacterium]|nr:aspartate aminotransferase family protein [Candidatus Hydrogenedentota bacterium]